MDSNHDKVIQSHLCYRYTTRQWEQFGLAQAARAIPIRVNRINFFMVNQGFQIGTKLNHCSGNSLMMAWNTLAMSWLFSSSVWPAAMSIG